MKAKPPVELVCHICEAVYYVQPYRQSISKCCSKHCGQRYAARFAAVVIGDKLRGTGTKHRYVKQGGRHQHRVVAEQVLGRKLMPGEVVHHRDDNGHNNSPENLKVTTQSHHIKIHWPAMMQARKRKAGY